MSVYLHDCCTGQEVLDVRAEPDELLDGVVHGQINQSFTHKSHVPDSS